jgi:hypothetical integral membrane protein (TIGR02206 family)
MFDIFFKEDKKFQLFGTEHLLLLLVLIFFGFLVISLSNKYLSENGKSILGGILASFVLLLVLFRIAILINIGEYSHQEELPLHLCRILPFFAVPMMFKRNRFLFGILYFYIVVGTTNSLITPDLNYALPNYSAVLYWLIHGVLALLPFYAIFVYKMRPNLKDLFRAIIYIHVYLVVIHLINLGLGSNYFYTVSKPEAATLLDSFGPWPWYILVTDILMWVLFTLVYLPFLKLKKAS